MPQIGVQQPTNLMEMYSSPSPMLWDIANTQVNQQRQSNEINQQQALQAMLFEKQDQPLNLQQKQATLDQMAAQLPGIRANSSLSQDKASLSRDTLGEQKKSALSKLALEVNENDLKAAETQVHMGMLSTDPKIRAQATEMSQYLSDIYKERQKIKLQTEGRLKEIAATNKGQADLEDKRIEAGKYKKSDKSSLSIATRVDMENDPAKKQAMLIDAAQQAQASGDADSFQYYMTRAAALDNAVKLQRAANPKAGAVDVGKVGQVPTNETPSAMPPAAPSPKLASNYAKPATQAEYDKLPSGTIYIDTDGKTKRKK